MNILNLCFFCWCGAGGGEPMAHIKYQVYIKKHTRFWCMFSCFWWLWSECYTPSAFSLDGSPSTRKIQTSLTLVFINYRPEPSVRFRLTAPDINKKHTRFWCMFSCFWWLWSESNRHSFRNLILSQARLPVPPQSQNNLQLLLFCFFCSCFLRFDLFHQTSAASWFMNRFFRRCCRFAVFLFNGFFNSSHFRC